MARTGLYSRHQPGGGFSIAELARHPNQVFFVHSGTGLDAAGKGVSPDAPYATVEYAIQQCTANKGDVIYVMPGHNEGAAAAIFDLDIAGVQIRGLGAGTLRPIFDFDHANATIDVGASNCAIENVCLRPSVTDVAIGIDVEAGITDTLLKDIEILPGEDGAGVDEFVLGIDIKAGCTRTWIVNPRIRQHASAAGCVAGIKLTGASDDVRIVNPDIVLKGAAAVAPINGGTTLSTNLRIEGGILVSDNEPGIELLTGTTGVISRCLIFSDLVTIAAAIVADGCALHECQYIEVGAESGAVIGTPSAND